MSRLRVVLAIPLAALSLSLCGGPAMASTSLPVTGYIEIESGKEPIVRNAPGLTTVAIDGINISADGTQIPPGTVGRAEKQLTQAYRSHKRRILLLGNYSSTLGDFDETAAHRMLTSSTNRHHVESVLADIANTGGWTGVQLDFEALNSTDRAGLTAFTTEMHALMAEHHYLSMAVMAGRSEQEYLDAGYDLPKLSKQLTTITLMAYDQHGPAWSGPGPIGGLPWAHSALVSMLTLVPADKIDLGVAGYGYTWPAAGIGTTVSDGHARKLAGSGATWDAAQAEWHAPLADGGTIWWSDARSLAPRTALATKFGLHGVAVWSLGLSDTITP